MSYTSITSVKTALWISWKLQDTVLAQLVLDVDTYLNKALDITSFDRGTITENVKYNPQAYSQYWYYLFYLRNFNVQSIQEVNGKTYSWTLNIDYQIQNSRVFQVRNLHQFFNPTYFDYMTIKYTYGYDRTPWSDTLPDDIELMARLLVIGLYNEKYPMGYKENTSGQANMQWVTNYRLWDESIQRASSLQVLWWIVWWKTEAERWMFKQLFMKYKKAQNALR